MKEVKRQTQQLQECRCPTCLVRSTTMMICFDAQHALLEAQRWRFEDGASCCCYSSSTKGCHWHI